MNKNEKEFWKQYKRWYLDDIQKCIDSNANFGAMTLILTTIDALGGFYKGLVKREVNEVYICSKCKTTKNVKKEKLLVLQGGKRNKPTVPIFNISGQNYEESSNRDVFVGFIKDYMHNFFQKIQQGTKKGELLKYYTRIFVTVSFMKVDRNLEQVFIKVILRNYLNPIPKMVYLWQLI